MPKVLSLDSVSLGLDGSIVLQFGLRIMEGEEVIHSSPHRRIINPGGDVDQNLDDLNDHFRQMGYSKIDQEMHDRVQGIADVAAKSNVIAAEQQKWIEAEEARKAEEAKQQAEGLS